MKHQWIEYPGTGTQEHVCKHGWEPMRQCEHCGAIQQREVQTLWMRVTGYRWMPLAGRCKGKKETPVNV